MDSNIDIVRVVKEKGLKFIDLQFTDVVGLVKSITIPSSELPDALKRGIWFDGSAIEGYARIAESDMHLIPDVSTFSILPWLTGDQATARLICDVFTPDGQPFQGDPRAVLRRAIDEAAKVGFTYKTGPEMEFFLMKPHPDGSLLPLAILMRQPKKPRGCCARWRSSWKPLASKLMRCTMRSLQDSWKLTYIILMPCVPPIPR
jgi:glutamine synthetase